SPDGRQLASLLNLTHVCLWQVAAGREYSSFELPRAAESTSLAGGEVSPDGRLLAVATGSGEGVRIFDVERRRQLTCLPVGVTDWLAFAPGGTDLYTCGPGGLYRWPLRTTDDADSFRLGPPQHVLAGYVGRVCLSQDGRLLAAIHGGGGVILRADSLPVADGS